MCYYHQTCIIPFSMMKTSVFLFNLGVIKAGKKKQQTAMIYMTCLSHLSCYQHFDCESQQLSSCVTSGEHFRTSKFGVLSMVIEVSTAYSTSRSSHKVQKSPSQYMRQSCLYMMLRRNKLAQVISWFVHGLGWKFLT